MKIKIKKHRIKVKSKMIKPACYDIHNAYSYIYIWLQNNMNDYDQYISTCA